MPDPDAHAHAPARPGAEPAGYGSGRSGRVRFSLDASGGTGVALLRDRVEEPYRAIAPKRLAALLVRG